MSPAPARTSRDAILSAARALLEEGGLDAVTMAAVGDRVGVRGPSLYKHVPNRAALIRTIAEAVTEDLGRALRRAVATGDPRADLRAATMAYRAFVHANPNGYGLLFANVAPELQPDPEVLAETGRPLVEAMGSLVGPDAALASARTVTAWAHGFVSMELAGAFRLGGDLDDAYEVGIQTILAGVSAAATPASRSRRRGSGTTQPRG
jgi:AcrR family transcriptional regulator